MAPYNKPFGQEINKYFNGTFNPNIIGQSVHQCVTFCLSLGTNISCTQMRGDKHFDINDRQTFLRSRGGTKNFTWGGGHNDVEEDMDVSEANFLVSEANIFMSKASKFSVGVYDDIDRCPGAAGDVQLQQRCTEVQQLH